jgi:hypothetical protein
VLPPMIRFMHLSFIHIRYAHTLLSRVTHHTHTHIYITPCAFFRRAVGGEVHCGGTHTLREERRERAQPGRERGRGWRHTRKTRRRWRRTKQPLFQKRSRPSLILCDLVYVCVHPLLTRMVYSVLSWVGAITKGFTASTSCARTIREAWRQTRAWGQRWDTSGWRLKDAAA